MRRSTSIIAAAACAALLGTAIAGHADHSYGAASRWRQLPATLAVTDDNAVSMGDVIGPWNDLARRVTGDTAFRLVDDADTADVVVAEASGDQTWVRVNGGTYDGGRLLGELESCTVNMAPQDWDADDLRVPIHELGHCLGFADHQNVSSYRLAAINPAVCDDSGHPASRDYMGVMSYCSFRERYWFGQDDEAMWARRYGDVGVHEPYGPQSPDGEDTSDTVVLVNARAAVDALVAGPLGHPILLVDRDRIPDPTADMLSDYSEAVVVGGSRQVSDRVVTALQDEFGLDVERLAGVDRYRTAKVVAENTP